MEDTAVDDEKSISKRRRSALKKVLYAILQNSTAMPFRYFANRYLCFYCCCPFSDSTKLKAHTEQEHEDAKLNNLLKGISVRSTIKLDVSQLACKLCNAKLINLDDLIKHFAATHSMEFEVNIMELLMPVMLSDHGMSCMECGLVFKFFGTLQTHINKTHAKSRTFLCEICGQGFVSKLLVKSHIKRAHEKSSCEQCNLSFSSYSKLNHHNQKFHGQKVLKCPQCSDTFPSRYLLKSHLANAHDVKSHQFYCDLCPKMFTLKSKLELHKRRIHLRERNCVCQICGFKLFNTDHLRRHMVKHTDARPFECEVCKKTFQRKKTLEFHRRIHTNDKRYACKDCGRAFVQMTSLKLHVKVHHSDNDRTSWAYEVVTK